MRRTEDHIPGSSKGDDVLSGVGPGTFIFAAIVTSTTMFRN
jgi:hypothetical protein